MPYRDDEEQSPNDIGDYVGETNDPNATFQREDNAESAEQNNCSENVANIVFTAF